MGLLRTLLIFFLGTFLLSCGKGGTGIFPVHPSGAWVSSGGESLKDANNPWWIKNVKQVRYCIAVDSSSISASKDQIRRITELAINYWKKEFARTSELFKGHETVFQHFNDIGVGTQEISQIECNGTEDLKIQFGYGTLSAEQIQYLEDPLKYIGIAVRTSYDPVNLKGRGFIFIGSDQGPHRFSPDSQADNVWKCDTLLFVALLHELGHVFGLPHVGTRYDLMGAQMLELVTDKLIAPIIEKMKFNPDDYQGFFIGTHWQGCYTTDADKQVMQKFFHIKSNCLYFRVTPDTSAIDIYSYDTDNVEKAEKIGSINSIDLTVSSQSINGIILYLNPLQQVFKPKGSEPLWLIPGPYFMYGMGGGKVNLNSGEKIPVHFEAGPRHFYLSTILDGKDTTIVFWSVLQ